MLSTQAQAQDIAEGVVLQRPMLRAAREVAAGVDAARVDLRLGKSRSLQSLEWRVPGLLNWLYLPGISEHY